MAAKSSLEYDLTDLKQKLRRSKKKEEKLKSSMAQLQQAVANRDRELQNVVRFMKGKGISPPAPESGNPAERKLRKQVASMEKHIKKRDEEVAKLNQESKLISMKEAQAEAKEYLAEIRRLRLLLGIQKPEEDEVGIKVPTSPALVLTLPPDKLHVPRSNKPATKTPTRPKQNKKPQIGRRHPVNNQTSSPENAGDVMFFHVSTNQRHHHDTEGSSEGAPRLSTMMVPMVSADVRRQSNSKNQDAPMLVPKTRQERLAQNARERQLQVREKNVAERSKMLAREARLFENTRQRWEFKRREECQRIKQLRCTGAFRVDKEFEETQMKRRLQWLRTLKNEGIYFEAARIIQKILRGFYERTLFEEAKRVFQLEKERQYVEDLESELKDMNKEADLLKKKISMLGEEIESLKTSCQNLEDAKAASQEEVRGLKDQVAQEKQAHFETKTLYEKERVVKESKIEALKKAKEDVKKLEEKLFDTIQQGKDALEKQRQEAEQALKEARETAADEKKHVISETHAAKDAEWEGKLQGALEAAKIEKQSELEDLKKQLLEEKHRAVQHAKEEGKNTLEHELEELRKQLLAEQKKAVEHLKEEKTQEKEVALREAKIQAEQIKTKELEELRKTLVDEKDSDMKKALEELQTTLKDQHQKTCEKQEKKFKDLLNENEAKHQELQKALEGKALQMKRFKDKVGQKKQKMELEIAELRTLMNNIKALAVATKDEMLELTAITQRRIKNSVSGMLATVQNLADSKYAEAIDDLNAKHQDEMKELRSRAEKDLQATLEVTRNESQKFLQTVKSEHRQAIDALNLKHKSSLEEIRRRSEQDHQTELEAVRSESQKQLQVLQANEVGIRGESAMPEEHRDDLSVNFGAGTLGHSASDTIPSEVLPQDNTDSNHTDVPAVTNSIACSEIQTLNEANFNDEQKGDNASESGKDTVPGNNTSDDVSSEVLPQDEFPAAVIENGGEDVVPIEMPRRDDGDSEEEYGNGNASEHSEKSDPGAAVIENSGEDVVPSEMPRQDDGDSEEEDGNDNASEHSEKSAPGAAVIENSREDVVPSEMPRQDDGDTEKEDGNDNASEHSEKSAPGGWSEHKDDNGTVYYFNTETGESQWEKPPELLATEKKAQDGSVAGESRQSHHTSEDSDDSDVFSDDSSILPDT